MSGPATLTIQDISVKRGEKLLISDMSLSLTGPKLLWVTGGNGIGKTSLLRTCAGLSAPDTGTVNWSISAVSVTAPSAVSFLPADSYAKSGMSAAEDAEFWGANLADTKIEKHGETITENLSTGQNKRLSVAKLLTSNKPIWILDEPLAGMDETGRVLIAEHIQAHVLGGGLALVASHAPIAVGNIPTQKLVLG